MFFAEKDVNGGRINYFEAVSGSLKLVPEGSSRQALAQDFASMRDDGLLVSEQPDFDATMETCAAIQDRVNRLA